MIISRLLKQRFTSILFTLLISLQISACRTEPSVIADTADINSDPSTDTADINSDPSTDTGIGTDKSSTVADINLSWAAPSAREDNSSISLSEIAGYHVYYGKTQGQYSNNISINDGTTTGYTLANLPTGTYYFVLTTLDTEGRESQFSPEVVIVI